MDELNGRTDGDAGPDTVALCLADDLLRGAAAIAEFLYGDAGQRRLVYHLAETGQLPIFRLGSVLCARKSTLLAWMARQEAAAVARVKPQNRKVACR